MKKEEEEKQNKKNSKVSRRVAAAAVLAAAGAYAGKRYLNNRQKKEEVEIAMKEAKEKAEAAEAKVKEAAEALRQAKEAAEAEEKEKEKENERRAQAATAAAAAAEAEARAKAEEAEAQAEEQRQAKAEAEAQAQQEAEERAKLEAEERAEAEAQAKAKAQAETEAETKAQAEREVREKVEAEERAKVEAEATAKAEAEAEAQAQAEREAREKVEAEAEAKARAKAEKEEEEKKENVRRTQAAAVAVAASEAARSKAEKKSRRKEVAVAAAQAAEQAEHARMVKRQAAEAQAATDARRVAEEERRRLAQEAEQTLQKEAEARFYEKLEIERLKTAKQREEIRAEQEAAALEDARLRAEDLERLQKEKKWTAFYEDIDANYLTPAKTFLTTVDNFLSNFDTTRRNLKTLKVDHFIYFKEKGGKPFQEIYTSLEVFVNIRLLAAKTNFEKVINEELKPEKFTDETERHITEKCFEARTKAEEVYELAKKRWNQYNNEIFPRFDLYFQTPQLSEANEKLEDAKSCFTRCLESNTCSLWTGNAFRSNLTASLSRYNEAKEINSLIYQITKNPQLPRTTEEINKTTFFDTKKLTIIIKTFKKEIFDVTEKTERAFFDLPAKLYTDGSWLRQKLNEQTNITQAQEIANVFDQYCKEVYVIQAKNMLSIFRQITAKNYSSLNTRLDESIQRADSDIENAVNNEITSFTHTLINPLLKSFQERFDDFDNNNKVSLKSTECTQARKSLGSLFKEIKTFLSFFDINNNLMKIEYVTTVASKLLTLQSKSGEVELLDKCISLESELTGGGKPLKKKKLSDRVVRAAILALKK